MIRLANTCVLPELCAAHPSMVADSLSIRSGRVVGGHGDARFTLDLKDHWALPGLINAHDHLHLNHVPPLTEDGPFANSYDWITACQPRLSDPAVRAAVAIPGQVRRWHGAIKNLLAGTTTVAHHDPWRADFERPDFPIRVVAEYGWAHSLGLSPDGPPDHRYPDLPVYGPAIRESFQQTPTHWPWMIHAAEGTDEITRRELSTLDEMGCLASNTVLIHGVGLSHDDILRIVESGASVVWCPSSNLRLLGKTLSPRALVNAGRLTLGADSSISGGGDILGEARLAGRESDLTPAELIRIVTLDAARILRLRDVGSLTPGCHADLIVFRRSSDNPFADLLDTPRARIRAVVKAGVPVVADPDLAPWCDAAGTVTELCMLDGRPKLCAASLFAVAGAELESGFDRCGSGSKVGAISR